jgi:hypothetical protein
MHEAKLAKMEAEMKAVFQQKVMEKESRLKQSEEELYARHREMKESLEKQRADLEEKKRRIESGRPLTPDRNPVSLSTVTIKQVKLTSGRIGRHQVEGCFRPSLNTWYLVFGTFLREQRRLFCACGTLQYFLYPVAFQYLYVR